MIQESQSTSDPSKRVGLAFTVLQVVLSVLGTIDASMLWLLDNHKADIPCTADGGCEAIANSIYSVVNIAGHSVQIALIGIIGYSALLTLAMAKAASETSKAINLISLAMVIFSGGGFIYSWYLQVESFTVIHKHCIYCIISACIMTILFFSCAIERRKLSQTGLTSADKI